MIKRIQLRGISRTPSDRGTADGGCDESVNVHLDEQETAPTIPATEISDDIYRTATIKYPILFIHKMTGVTNYIGCLGVNLRAYGSTLAAAGESLGTSLGTGETFKSATSIGNTLIIYSNVKPYYFLFKNGEYSFLGNSIPAPAIEFLTAPISHSNVVPIGTGDVPSSLVQTSFNTMSAAAAAWRSAFTDDSDVNHSAVLTFLSTLWGKIKVFTDNMRDDGLFFAPFFIRYALKLYNGEYIHISVPILCRGCRDAGGGSISAEGEPWVDCSLSQISAGYYIPTCVVTKSFKVCLKMADIDLESWSDIVDCVDVFASTPIYTPLFDAAIIDVDGNGKMIFDGMDSENVDNTIKEAFLSKAQFFKIASYDLSDSGVVDKLKSGRLKIDASDDVSGEKLATHDDLKDGYRTSSEYIPANGALNINSRALLVGVKETMPTGYSFMNGLVAKTAQSGKYPQYGYALVYKIDDITVQKVIIRGRYIDGEMNLLPGFVVHGNTRADEDPWWQYFGNEDDPEILNPDTSSNWPVVHSVPYSWLAYPDARCNKVEVFEYSQTSSSADPSCNVGKVIPLKPHPLLDCSYAFLGINKSIRAIMSDTDYEDANLDDLLPTVLVESRTIEHPNKIYLSNFDNPFIFSAGGIVTFSDDVIGVAMTSVPLSEGQMGQFDLYAFTNGGIRTLALSSDGTIVHNNVIPNVSQHIALPGTITALDQAVVFTTKRGVMLLQGHKVTELSANMIGKPFVLDNDMTALLGESEWASVMDAIPNSTETDIETFMEFVSAAKPAYDSAGRRIIFFRPQRNYQYVYMLNTATWHKAYQNVTPYKVLNSYPDCLIAQYHASGLQAGARVYNFSTILDDSTLFIPGGTDTRETVKAIIVTRPFDLGEPDIRKAIKSLRIRGVYKNEMSGGAVTRGVCYILQASYDGLTWRRMQSLRGGSYKMFRLVLLAMLMPEERISWIDIDYEARFANRLR